MSEVTYRIVEHDGGFAYKVGDVFSETFPKSRRGAASGPGRGGRAAGSPARRGHPLPGSGGGWHDETAQGSDRPRARVVE